jgi:hypothetical protein
MMIAAKVKYVYVVLALELLMVRKRVDEDQK